MRQVFAVFGSSVAIRLNYYDFERVGKFKSICRIEIPTNLSSISVFKIVQNIRLISQFKRVTRAASRRPLRPLRPVRSVIVPV
jgi:hypothetical protein